MEEKYLRYNINLMECTTWLIVSPDPMMREMDAYVQEVGDFHLTGKHSTERDGLQSFQISYTLWGEMTLSYRGKEHPIQGGDVMWLDCRDHYLVRGNHSSNSVFVHFYCGMAPHYYGLFYPLNNDSPIVRMQDPTPVEKEIRQLIQLYRDRSSLDVDLQAVQILFSIMTRLIMEVYPGSGGQHGIHVEKMIQFMHEHYREKITLDQIAATVHMSKFHLSRLFRQATGSTPNEYLIKLRIGKAKELLRQTDLSINQISERVGIDSPSYFIKLFRRYETVSPGEYRKQWCGQGKPF